MSKGTRVRVNAIIRDENNYRVEISGNAIILDVVPWMGIAKIRHKGANFWVKTHKLSLR